MSVSNGRQDRISSASIREGVDQRGELRAGLLRADARRQSKASAIRHRPRGVPEGADLGLGCGNPNAIAALGQARRSSTSAPVGGFTAFIAARAVGRPVRVSGST